VVKLDDAGIEVRALVVLVVMNLVSDHVNLIASAAHHFGFNEWLRGIFILLGLFFVFSKWRLGLVALGTLPAGKDLSVLHSGEHVFSTSLYLGLRHEQLNHMGEGVSSEHLGIKNTSVPRQSVLNLLGEVEV
jgi:hypothetical protein